MTINIYYNHNYIMVKNETNETTNNNKQVF